MRISGTVNDSIVDGPGLRFTIFVQGCPHHCKGCHNPQTHSFMGGEEVTLSSLLATIKANPLLDGVTFSGGEPFCKAEELGRLGKAIQELGLNVITYTGYTFEYLWERQDERGIGELLAVTDILIDGKFVEELRSYDLRFRGSANQRLLDVKQSMRSGRAVEIESLEL